MKYKGYTAKIEPDPTNECFHGRVLGISDVVAFEGNSFEELKNSFHQSVDDYLAFCEEEGVEANKPYSGKFVVRIDPELHRSAAIMAEQHNMSLNAFVELSLEQKVNQTSGSEAPETERRGIVTIYQPETPYYQCEYMTGSSGTGVQIGYGYAVTNPKYNITIGRIGDFNISTGPVFEVPTKGYITWKE